MAFRTFPIAALFENEELRLQLSFLDIKIQANYTLKDFYWDTNRKLEVERPQDHAAICPLLRYFKPMKPVRYVYFNDEMVLFSGSE